MEKGKITFFLPLLLVGIFFIGCQNDDDESSIIEQIVLDLDGLNGSDVEIGIGELKSIIVKTSSEADAENANIVWSSSNAGIVEAKFNDRGLFGGIKGVSLGEATISAKPNTRDGAVTIINVNVVTKIESITLEREITPNPSEINYKVSVFPEDANQSLRWRSSNEEVATVENGLVKAVGEGETTITVETLDGEKNATALVTVNGEPPVIIVSPVESISLERELTSNPDEVIYRPVFTPADATNKTVVWTSSNVAVATVDDNGLVKAVGNGTTTITATTEQGNRTATGEVVVNGTPPIIIIVPVESITLERELTSNPDEVIYNPTIVPANASNKNISWTSSNPSVTTVDNNGLVKAIGSGSTTITATTEEGNKTATAEVVASGSVIIINPVQSISIEEQLPAPNANQAMYNATVLPVDASNKNVIWTSSNLSAATVDNNGLVTAVAAGAAIITATTEEGGKTASVEIVVSGTPAVIARYCDVDGFNTNYNINAFQTTGGTSNINFASTVVPPNNYEHYTDEKIVVARGDDFTIDVTQSNAFSRTYIWIDWNGNREFEGSELVEELGEGEMENPVNYTVTISVPADAKLGNSRIRVLTGDAWTHATAPASICDFQRASGTKDFDIEIQN